MATGLFSISMGLFGIIEAYALMEWQHKLAFTVVLLALPFLITFAVTSTLSIVGKRSKAGLIEAPPIPYFVPFIGNVFSFAADTFGTFKNITRDFYGIPVKLRLGPEKYYIVSGVPNIRQVFNRSRELSTKALTLEVIVNAFGMPRSDAKIYEADDSGLYLKPAPGSKIAPEMRLLHISHHQFGQELTGMSLVELSRQFVRNFASQIKKKREDMKDGWTEMPDIYKFVRNESFKATTTALCGEHMLRLNPDFASDFWTFDDWLPLILKHIPQFFIPKAFAIRDNCHKQVAKWHRFAEQHLDCTDETLNDVLWEPIYGHRLMRERAKMYKATNVVSDAGRAATDLGMIWGANVNIVPSATWSLIHILSDDSLTKRIRREIEPAFSSDEVESVDVAKLGRCPLLQSVIAEVLRLNVAVMIVRTSTIPMFQFGNWFVKPDNPMLINPYFSHHDDTVWNTGLTLPNGTQEHPLDTFWAERFLEYPNDYSSGPTKKPVSLKTHLTEPQADIMHNDKEAKFTIEGLKGIYIPFGGGTNMCPGIHYAKNEMALLIAMLLWSFDMEFVDAERARGTGQNMKTFAVSTLTPDRENAVRLRRRVM